MNADERYLTAREVATILSMSVEGFRRARREGRLGIQPVRLGSKGRLRFLQSDVETLARGRGAASGIESEWTKDGGRKLSGIQEDGTWLPGRVVEIAEEVKVAMGETYDEAFAPTVHLFAIALWRIERGARALYELDDEHASVRLEQDVRGWVGTAKRLAETLALTPLARARLQLNEALTERAGNLNAIPPPSYPEHSWT